MGTTPQAFIPINMGQAGLQELVDGVMQYGWIFEWGMFILLLVAAGASAWIFIDSSQKRKADKALMPRILSLVGIFFVLPAFIFRYTGTADGYHLAVRLMADPGEPFYPNPINWNINWLVAGYGPKIALLALVGAAVSILGAIIYGSTVSRQRPSTEFVSALNNQFGELRQEIQSVKSRSAGPTMTPGGMPTSTVASGMQPRSAATVIERPSSAATIIERPGGGAMAEVRVVSGPSVGKVFKIPAGEAKIGRDSGNIVAIDDPKASREHAKFRFADGVHTLIDLGSANGTYVNDQRIGGQTPLADGDLIRIGDTVMSFKPAGA
jgi:hypothetical protein